MAPATLVHPEEDRPALVAVAPATKTDRATVAAITAHRQADQATAQLPADMVAQVLATADQALWEAHPVTARDLWADRPAMVPAQWVALVLWVAALTSLVQAHQAEAAAQAIETETAITAHLQDAAQEAAATRIDTKAF